MNRVNNATIYFITSTDRLFSLMIPNNYSNRIFSVCSNKYFFLFTINK